MNAFGTPKHKAVEVVHIDDPLVLEMVKDMQRQIIKQQEVIALVENDNRRLRGELQDKNEELKYVYALLDAAQAIVDQVSKQLMETSRNVSKLRVDVEVRRNNRRI
jgi:septal ring factor EnvC (AmiA/AmiB activator)